MKLKSIAQTGDTIVEVMLAILVAGVALAVAYQLSNASLRTSTQAVQRSQALSYASAQLEMMKSCYYQGPPTCFFDSTYRIWPQTDFCVKDNTNASGGPPIRYPFDTTNCGPSGSPLPFDIFTIKDHYDGPVNKGGTDTFTVTVTWPNINGHGNDQQVLYYRFPQ